MIDHDPDEDGLYEDYDDLPDEPQPIWTKRRVLLTVVVLIILVTFLAYSFQGLFIPPPPPPTLAPGSLI